MVQYKSLICIIKLAAFPSLLIHTPVVDLIRLPSKKCMS